MRLSLLFPVLLIANVIIAGAQEIDPGDVVRVNTTLVTVPVRVMDRNGKYVPDMHENEFQVFEDGVEQRLAHFAPVEAPFTIVLMIDISDSTESNLKEIKEAARAFMTQLRSKDEVILITFDKRPVALNQPTTDRPALHTLINGLVPGSGTRLYDSLDTVFKRLLPQIKGRKAIVLFTDGVDIDSRNSAGQLLRRAEEIEGLIYSVRYNTYGAVREKIRAANASSPVPILAAEKGSREEDYTAGRAFLNGLAIKTGAEMYETSDPHKLSEAFARIAEELRWQYSLGYYPTNPGNQGEKRKIKVRIRRPNLSVRARSSYIYLR